jgi:GH15 family glucan-1,4-alpha-glucosidase
MPARIEDYAFIGDMHGSALVSRDGSVDWLCIPRFDSDACMAALLGRDEHGCWVTYPASPVRRVERRYRPGTLILETDYACDGGAVRIIDFMPLGPDRRSLVRIVEGLDGKVAVDAFLVVRFGFGAYHPWITRPDGEIELTVAPDSLVFRSPMKIEVVDDRYLRTAFDLRRGERASFELTWHPSSERPPDPLDAPDALAETEKRSKEWASRSKYHGPYEDAVNRSLIVLKAMIYAPTGGIVAAPTTALPEEIGGVRNWDYRYCWLRDATLTLDGLMLGGYTEEAAAWQAWLLKAVAGAPDETQIMYGIHGERRLTELELPWLPGYADSRPVRIGNAASEQFQLDVYGEVVQMLYEARRLGVPESRYGRSPATTLMDFLETAWQRPDNGIWEMRSEPRHFVHSKMMAWVAFDRMLRLVDELTSRDDPLRSRLRRLRSFRDRIHRDVCEHGFDSRQNTFVQAYNQPQVDAALLLMPALGFLPASDSRVQGTIRAIEQRLLRDGFVTRYEPERSRDGLAGFDRAFLPCSFWLVDAYAYSGRRREAEELFDRLLLLRNDLGLLSEEYDPEAGRLLGNFPQALTHLALIHSASVLADAELTARADGAWAGARGESSHAP